MKSVGVAAAVALTISGVAWGGVRSGHAELELIKGSDSYTAGKPFTLGIELKMDRAWHTYWVNPGEGGMKPSISWTLPEGWVAGPVLFPLPMRFMSGDLVGYGYEKTVVLPVFMTPATDASGPVEIGAKVSWLTCSDKACVPGSAEVTVQLDSGSGKPGAGAKALAAALEQVPEPLSGAHLELVKVDAQVTLEIRLPSEIDASGAQVFPITAAALDHGQPIMLEAVENGWRAKVAANEYAPEQLEDLEIVLGGGSLKRPLLLKWSAPE